MYIVSANLRYGSSVVGRLLPWALAFVCILFDDSNSLSVNDSLASDRTNFVFSAILPPFLISGAYRHL